MGMRLWIMIVGRIVMTVTLAVTVTMTLTVTVAVTVAVTKVKAVEMMRFAIVINTSSARITCLYIAGFSIKVCICVFFFFWF